MGGDACQDVGHPCARIDDIHLRRDDQAEHGHGPVAAAVGSGEEPAFAAQRHAPQGPLRRIVGHAGPFVALEAGEGWPALEHVGHGLGLTNFAEWQRSAERAVFGSLRV